MALAVLTLTACADVRPAAQRSGAEAERPARGKTTITLAVATAVASMGIMGYSTTSGGWPSANEIHSNGLITSDVHTRKPIGRLAERVPSFEDGTLAMLLDGRMRVEFPLRKDVTWHDGTPFTAQDLVFSYRLNSDPTLPTTQRPPIKQMASVEAPDDYTFVIYFKGPYYAATSLGLRPFWPHPRHLLEPAYERFLASGNSEEIVNLPYWTSAYVHLGPFRLVSFDPAQGIVFQAYDRYFLGRPKVDEIQVQIFLDDNALFAALLAGTVDVIVDGTLDENLGFELIERWKTTGDGTMYAKYSANRFLSPQFRPHVQTEPANLDPRVRAALYHAIDREALAEGLQAGHRELAAWELLPPGELLHPATKDAFRRYVYDPRLAQAGLRDAGWMAGADGALRNQSDGRRYRTVISGSPLDVAATADYWRRIGLAVEEYTVPAAQVRNAEFRASFPSWELSSAGGGGDGILVRLEWPAPGTENRWVGSNRGGYDNPRTRELINAYYASPSEADQFRTMKDLSDYLAEDLPLLMLYNGAGHIGVRKGIKALDDQAGAAGPAQLYGTTTRNAHLWEVL
jgi:peptide/nickel transport system substrate-binding protein